jgi:uncharacterized membrane protein YbaN (DUF454 family)
MQTLYVIVGFMGPFIVLGIIGIFLVNHLNKKDSPQ